jgi:hypothetical protein
VKTSLVSECAVLARESGPISRGAFEHVSIYK